MISKTTTKPTTKTKTTKPTLKSLAEQINKEQTATLKAACMTLERAKRCGDLLREAKDRVKHGSWETWVEKNCSVSVRQSRKYMTLSQHWELLENGPETDLDLGLNEALQLINDARRPTAADRQPVFSPSGKPRESRPLQSSWRESDTGDKPRESTTIPITVTGADGPESITVPITVSRADRPEYQTWQPPPAPSPEDRLAEAEQLVQRVVDQLEEDFDLPEFQNSKTVGPLIEPLRAFHKLYQRKLRRRVSNG